MFDRVPDVTFKTRVRDESIEGPNPFRWQDVTTEDYFAGKQCIVFSLPGAFTPTCSTYQLPDYEKLYPEFQEVGIDEIYCISVNDSFVMNKWAEQVVDGGLKNVKVIPDGSGTFTEAMDMLVDKDNLGFGKRSWRYAMFVSDGNIIAVWPEDNKRDNADDDPYEHSSPQAVLEEMKHLSEIGKQIYQAAEETRKNFPELA